MSASLIPRLSSSTKWTDLPVEFIDKIRLVFEKQFKHESARGSFIVEGRIYPEEIAMRLGYLENGRLKQINFEASVDLPKSLRSTASLSEEVEQAVGEMRGETEDGVMERLYSCIDALGSLMEEYFQTNDEADMDISVIWKAYDFEGGAVFLQYSTVNSSLEEEADRILGLAALSLVKEFDTNNEDALTKAEIDSELAFEVQKFIRAGKHPLQMPSSDEDSGQNLN